MLKYYHALEEKEKILKKRIKKCIEEYGGNLIKDSRLLKINENTLLKIYDEINVQHLSHLIVFYSFLIIKNTEEKLITLLTTHSLDDFIKYKKELKIKNISFLQNENYFYFCNQCIKGCIVTLNCYAISYFVDSIVSFVDAVVK